MLEQAVCISCPSKPDCSAEVKHISIGSSGLRHLDELQHQCPSCSQPAPCCAPYRHDGDGLKAVFFAP